jgi:hypothetical protein
MLGRPKRTRDLAKPKNTEIMGQLKQILPGRAPAIDLIEFSPQLRILRRAFIEQRYLAPD